MKWRSVVWTNYGQRLLITVCRLLRLQAAFERTQAATLQIGSAVFDSAASVAASTRRTPLSKASDDKENTPPQAESKDKKQKKTVLHAFSSKRRKSERERAETSGETSLDDPSSVDDVFRSAPNEEEASGRSAFVSSLFRVASPSSRVAATHSWKDKISNAISRTGLRLKTSKRKKSPDEHFDVAPDAPIVPPLPEFLKNMVTNCSSQTESADIAPRSVSPTRERLSRFFSRESSESPPSPAPQAAHDVDSLARPPLHERVTTIADRKITQAVPRDQLSDVIFHPYGMSSHLSLHEPDLPICKLRYFSSGEPLIYMSTNQVLHPSLMTTAGAAEKVTRPMFETEVSKSESRAVEAASSAGALVRHALSGTDKHDGTHCFRCADA